MFDAEKLYEEADEWLLSPAIATIVVTSTCYHQWAPNQRSMDIRFNGVQYLDCPAI